MKILLAFTESQITDVLSMMLVDSGWPRPGVAHNSDDAVAWINENGGCDLLISEVYFAPADGFTLRDTVAPFLPGMRTLFCSKFEISQYLDRLAGCPFLTFPPNFELFRKTVSDLIGELRQETPLSASSTQPREPELSLASSADIQTKVPDHPQPENPSDSAAPPKTTKETKKKSTSKKSIINEQVGLILANQPPESSTPSEPSIFPLQEPTNSPEAPSATPPKSPSPESAPPSASFPPMPESPPPPSAPKEAARPTPRIPTTTIKIDEPADLRGTAVVQAAGSAIRRFPPTAAKAAPTPKLSYGSPKIQTSPGVLSATSPKTTAQNTSAPIPRIAASNTAPKLVKVSVSPAAAGPVRTQLPPDDLVGTSLGNYEIQTLFAKFQTERLYRARQTNIERQVLLTVLDLESAKDTAVLERFLADSRAKARVSHSTIAAVYEGGFDRGFHFYSSEFAPVPTLAQVQAQGGQLKPLVALQIFKVVAEAFAYFSKEGIARQPLTPEAILLKPGGAPRLANIACGDAASSPSDASEMEALGGFVHKSLTQTVDSKAAREIAARLLHAVDQPITWTEVAALAESKIPKAAPADAAKIQARDIAVSRAVGETRKKNRMRVIIGSTISLALTAGACFAIYFHLTRSSQIQVDDLGAMIEIPAGEFPYQEGSRDLPRFYISKYEVSIYEYKKFLDALDADPGLAKILAHPDQPPEKSHIPKGWADETKLEPPNPGYFNRARKWGQYQGAPLSLDSPVFGVDWFDAYAYAKWKGHQLPTEEQWEKAARGAEGGKYPWGNYEELSRANTGVDFTANPDPKKGGEKDGFKRSSPVNKPASDKSPYGVVGLAGNVSEWTATLAEDPEMPGEQIPVIRGGNWKNPAGSASTRRVIKLDELMSDETLGFRTVSDGPPAQ